MATIEKRYDFVFYFDVQDGNPNGDPDAGNLPRIDAETGLGLVTDVCLKRKVRNFVLLNSPGRKDDGRDYDVFIKEKAVLNNLIKEAMEDEKVKPLEGGRRTEAARQWMCRKYYDIRTFGAVMSTGENAGQVRGPVQLTFARSVEPIVALEHTITRMAVATEEEAKKQSGDNRTMGRKYTVPYALYRAHGFINPFLAAQTGFDHKDLELFWQALLNMFEHDRTDERPRSGRFRASDRFGQCSGSSTVCARERTAHYRRPGPIIFRLSDSARRSAAKGNVQGRSAQMKQPP